MKFTAPYTDAYATSVTANVMFTDPETDPDQPSVLSFSRPIEKGFEDCAYYFEVNDQSYGSYMGLESVKVSRNSIEVRVEARVVEKFGVEDFAQIDVQFDVNDAKYQAILEQMRQIFKGYEEIYQEI